MRAGHGTTGTRTRRHPGVRGWRLQDRVARVDRAAVRAEERASRSAAEQLDRLDRILGPGVGATRERKRLRAQVETARAHVRTWGARASVAVAEDMPAEAAPPALAEERHPRRHARSKARA